MRIGYGQIGSGGKNGPHLYAHRVSWELYNHWKEPVPPGLQVCHHCDNRACVNPVHLFVGTPADNSADMKAKGRSRSKARPGEQHHNARLTEQQVIEIRRLHSAGNITQREISRRFDVSESAVSGIILRKNWACIP
jgi:predicted XRE-type DNA-binding protein